MRVVRNDAFIKRRVQFTQRGSLVGMGLLLVSLVVARTNVILSWGLLLAGFFVAMASVRLGNRFVRPPRADEVLDKVLKGLDNRYMIYHYMLPAEHVLLTPSGLIAIRTQEQRGKIVVRAGRWQQRSVWQRLRVIFGEAGLGNPDRKLRQDMEALHKRLAELPVEAEDVPVEGVIVFHAGGVTLETVNPEFPTVLPADLKATVRGLAEAHPALPGRSHKALAAALEGEEMATATVEETEEEPEEAPAPKEKRSRKRSRSRKTKKA